jgi:hypothetical protein
VNRKQRRAYRHQQHEFVRDFPESLTPIPIEEFPTYMNRLPSHAWRSRKYLAQLWQEDNPDYPGLLRLSVCRVRLGSGTRLEDGLTWDELQSIKREIGYGEWYAIEVYPPDDQVVNVANFRHLWILPKPLSIGF